MICFCYFSKHIDFIGLKKFESESYQTAIFNNKMCYNYNNVI